MRLVAVVLTLGLLVCLGCSSKPPVGNVAGEAIKLEYKTHGGVPAQFKMAYSVSLNIGGTTQEWMSDIVYSSKVDSIAPDGTIVRRITFDDFSIAELSGGAPTPDPEAAGYKGQYLWLKLGPAGEVADWKGLDGIRNYTPELRDLKSVLVLLMALSNPPMPAEAASVGTKWQTKLELPVMMAGGDFNLTITTNYEVASFGVRAGSSCARVRFTSDCVGSGTGFRSADRKYWLDQHGQGKGDLWFDHGSGLVIDYSLNLTVDQVRKYERAGKEDIATEASTVDSGIKIKVVR
ncbi:MAG: hypothetical protein WAW06_02345 [bacterium]